MMKLMSVTHEVAKSLTCETKGGGMIVPEGGSILKGDPRDDHLNCVTYGGDTVDCLGIKGSESICGWCPKYKSVRDYNVGSSDYSERKIQPWDIWYEYNLNPWDADIVKRVLRTKQETLLSSDEARVLDYKKIKHICDERIRQIEDPTPKYIIRAY